MIKETNDEQHCRVRIRTPASRCNIGSKPRIKERLCELFPTCAAGITDQRAPTAFNNGGDVGWSQRKLDLFPAIGLVVVAILLVNHLKTDLWVAIPVTASVAAQDNILARRNFSRQELERLSLARQVNQVDPQAKHFQGSTNGSGVFYHIGAVVTANYYSIKQFHGAFADDKLIIAQSNNVMAAQTCGGE